LPQTRRECRWDLAQGSDERRQHRQECSLQFTRQATKLAVESRQPLERRHV
jgi:hypothetical protein